MSRKKQTEELENYSIYKQKWVEKSAMKGFERFFKSLKESYPEDMRDKLEIPAYKNHIRILYFTAFEDALNTFFVQCLDDTISQLNLYMDELGKVTATITDEFKK